MITVARPLSYFASLAVLVAVYFIAGKVGLMLAFVNPSATAVWPPAGIALAALLLLGYRAWPAILLGAFLVNVTTAGSAATSVGIAVGNSLEAILGAFLVTRFANARDAFDRAQDVFRFALLAAGLSTTVSATLGVTSLAVGGFASWDMYGSVWLTWWLGDAVGDLIVTPLVVLWALNPRLDWNGGRLLEALALLLSVLVVGLMVFGGFYPFEIKNYPLEFMCVPLLVWAAFRFTPREAATATFLLSIIAITGTFRGIGPFVWQSQNESLLLLQAFLGVVAVTTISLAAVASERKRFETQLQHLADHDPLTDLVNRRRFQEELAHELAKARRYGLQGALLFLDLDDFKTVNDNLGHGAGDRLLASISRLLRGRLRDSDRLARLGGDEFGILLPHTEGERAQSLANQLLEAIEKHSVVVRGRPVGVTASIGIALYPPHGATVRELLARADSAMYQAKAAGQSRSCLYRVDSGWKRRLESRFRSERSVRDALERGFFLLHGQPILDLRRNRVSQYELLLRMVGENGEPVPPAAFLGIAERAGLIQTIDRWVVRQAIYLLAATKQHGPQLSVNLSGRALSDAGLLPMIEQEVAATGINPSGLIFEITETAAITDVVQAQEFARALRGLGCQLALDDFGVGSSSLHQLKSLPVDYLKLDGSFIRDFAHNLVDQHLVKAMVSVARALGQRTIAEFVGEEETVRLLQKCGVDYAQGYHIGRPRPLSEIEPFRERAPFLVPS